MIDSTNLTQVQKVERTLIAEMLFRPKQAFSAVERLGIDREDFTEQPFASAFSAMLHCGPDDEDKLRKAFSDAVPEIAGDDTKLDEFLELAVSPARFKYNMIEFAGLVLSRKCERQVRGIMNDAAKPLDLKLEECKRVMAECERRKADLDRYVGSAVFDDEPGAFDGTAATPEHLLDMPGFVHDYAEHIYSTAHRPNRVLAFAGALSMLSLLVGRKYTDSRKTMTNLYLVALANSGVGKGAPLDANKMLAEKHEFTDRLAAEAGSGQGFQDAVWESPSILFQMDEFDTVLNMLKESNASTEGLFSVILSFFTESKTSHKIRKLSLKDGKRQQMLDANGSFRPGKSAVINNPSVVIYGTAIPACFYKSLTHRVLENGFFARLLILEAGTRGNRGKAPGKSDLFPSSVTDFVQFLLEKDRMQPWNQRVDFTVVEDEPGVDELVTRISDEADARYVAAEESGDSAGMAVWNRSVEITGKLALLYALSENILRPKVSVAGVEWAWRLVSFVQRRALAMANEFLVTDQDDDDCSRIIRFLDGRKSKEAARGEISRYTHLSKQRMDRAEPTLTERGQIRVVSGANGSKIYKLLKRQK